MNKKYILTASAAAMVLSIATAGVPSAVKTRDAGKHSLQSLTTKTVGSEMTGEMNKGSRVFFMNPLGEPINSTRSEGEEYTPAEEITLLTEDFSSELFQTGKVGKPDINTSLIDPDYMNFPHPAWYNLRPEAFGDGTVIWGGNNLFPAGGTACLYYRKLYNITESNIVIPLVDASTEGYEGIVHVEFIARLAEDATEDSSILIEAAETNDMGSTWDMMGSGVATVTNEWRKYDAAFYGGRGSVISNIYNSFGQPIYIDDIRIYQVGQPCMTPVAQNYSDYVGDSFTANWDAAKGAEYYLLNVYHEEKEYDKYGQVISNEVTYLLQDHPVSDTSFKVECEPGVKYIYNVRSVKDDYVSLFSNSIEVSELLPTTMHEVTNFGSGKLMNEYTASWDEIAGAERYNYAARFIRTSKEDGQFVVTNENFTNVVDPDGNLTGYTIEEPANVCYTEYYVQPMIQQGWRLLNGMPYSHYLCVDTWQYIYGNGDSGLLSPQLDLSKDGGKLTVTVDLAANLFDMVDEETGKHIKGYPRAAAVIFNFDEEKGDYRQDELYYADDLTEKWQTKTFNFTTGSEKSVIGIYGTWAPENMYIDNLKVVQNYNAGESLLDPFHFARFVDGTEYTLEVPGHVFEAPIYHQVCGVRAERVEGSLMNEIGFLTSPWTPLELVKGSESTDWSNVATPTLTGATVQPVDVETILVLNPERANVTVCDINGRVIYSAAGIDSQKVNLGGRGLYLVKVGNHTIKVHM